MFKSKSKPPIIPALLAFLCIGMTLHLSSWWADRPLTELTAAQRERFPPPKDAQSFGIAGGHGLPEGYVDYSSNVEAKRAPFTFGFLVLICICTGGAAIYGFEYGFSRKKL